MLGPSVDEMDELEDEVVELDGIRFIAAESFIDTYGAHFEMVFKDGSLALNPVSNSSS